VHQLKKDYPDMVDEYEPLPLHGQLQPEEQDKVMKFHDEPGNKDRRMIVFCTNVAETSLTVPGTKLVFDLGLAKEARYDPTKRITTVELTPISKSSANQRKGRAGRLSEGHCVRLFREEFLVRENIEPEILRSSLDQVILQLYRLNQDPSRFSFPHSTKFCRTAMFNRNFGSAWLH